MSDVPQIASMNALPVAIGDATFLPEARELVLANDKVVLEPRLADLLSYLVAAPGKVARDELLNAVWGDEGSDEALTQAISKLRRHLGDEQRPYRLIRTIPKFGYALDSKATNLARVQMVQSVPDTNQSNAALEKQLKSNRSFYQGIAVGVGLMCVIILLYAVLNRPTQVELEREMILCPPDAPPESCAKMLQEQS
ncbi:MAG: winged helix-turn-helix domain-containing protein [Pseudomonadota bacterium]